MIRNTFILALLTLSALPAAATEDYSALQRQMAACDTDEQCIVAEALCGGWTAINKANQSRYDEFLHAARPTVNCITGNPTPKPVAAQCLNTNCEIQ